MPHRGLRILVGNGGGELAQDAQVGRVGEVAAQARQRRSGAGGPAAPLFGHLDAEFLEMLAGVSEALTEGTPRRRLRTACRLPQGAQVARQLLQQPPGTQVPATVCDQLLLQPSDRLLDRSHPPSTC